MSEQLWYYIDNAQAQQGPITIPQLQALVGAGSITPESMVWTEALGEQWIPACNVEGLFPKDVPVAPDPNTASIAVKAPSQMADAATIADEIAHAAAPPEPAPAAVPAPAVVQDTLRDPSAVAQQPQQPQTAPTTPMIPSTPTTQPVAGTAAPIPGMEAAASADVAAQPQVAGEVSPKKGVNVVGIVLLVIGIGVAGYGATLLSHEDSKGLCYGLLGGGGVVAILGLIMTLKGKKSATETILAPSSPALSGLGGAAAMGADGAVHPGMLDLSAVAEVAPIPAGTAPVAIKAPVNPLLGANAQAASATTDAKPSPFAGVQASTRPNPLLSSGAAITPQNRLNTALPAQSASPTAEESQS